MIGLFSFDGPLYKDKNGVYCNITLTNEMFARYFSVVDFLYVVVRTFHTEKTFSEMNMRPLNTDKMSVIEVENLNSISGFLKKKKLQTRISGLINKADLIFARMPSIVSNVVSKLAFKAHKPYLVEVGGCAWDSYWNHGIIGKIIAPYMFFQARKHIRRASYATYVTRFFLQKRYPTDGIFESCSNVYLSDVDDSVLKQRRNKIARVDVTHPIFGQAVNSIDVRYKGEHRIIKAMKHLKEHGIFAEFQVVGPGEGRFLKAEAIRCGVSEQLKLLGTLQKHEIQSWLEQIDVYVQPSQQEGLPRSVIEAMSVGCPAVGSRIAGIPELLDEHCLFNPKKSKELVSTLCWILDKENLMNESSKNFDKAKQYQKVIIDERRLRIFKQYMESLDKKC